MALEWDAWLCAAGKIVLVNRFDIQWNSGKFYSSKSISVLNGIDLILFKNSGKNCFNERKLSAFFTYKTIITKMFKHFYAVIKFDSNSYPETGCSLRTNSFL